MNEGFFLIIENETYVFVLVYTMYKSLGSLFDQKRALYLNKIKYSNKIIIEQTIKEQNNFRFDIINVTLEKGNPIIKHITNVDIIL